MRGWIGRLRGAGALAAAATVVIAGAGCGSDSEKPSSAGGESGATSRLIVGVPALPVTLDSMFAPGQESVEAIVNLYDNTLCYRTSEGPDGFEAADVATGEDAMEGCLLDKVEASEDGKTYTLHVRPGVKDADGDVLTAEDVKWSFDRSFGTKAVGAYIMGVAGVASPDDVKVIDESTLEIELRAPSPIFKRVLNVHSNSPWNASVVQKHATAGDKWATTWLKQNAAGFGPYVMSEVTSTQATFTANPNYWQGKPAYDTVIYRQIPDGSQRLSLLKAGEIDVAEGLSVLQTDALAGSGTQPINTVQNQILYAAMNAKHPPLADKRVRQALNYAVPTQEIVDTIYKGNASELPNMLPPDYPEVDPELSPYQEDSAKAKALLAEAGASGLQLTMTVNGDIAEHSDVAVLIRNSFADAGVKLSIQKLPTAAYLAAAQTGKTQLWLQQSYSIVPDVAYHYATYISPTGPLAYNAFKNAEYEKLIAKSTVTPNGPARTKQLLALQKLVAEEAPQLSIATVPTTYGLARDLQGYTWFTNNQLRFDRFTR